jgi:hypothetical protein
MTTPRPPLSSPPGSSSRVLNSIGIADIVVVAAAAGGEV